MSLCVCYMPTPVERKVNYRGESGVYSLVDYSTADWENVCLCMCVRLSVCVCTDNRINFPLTAGVQQGRRERNKREMREARRT